MMKKLYLLAAAALTLAACTDEVYLGENKEFTNTDKVIGFNMSTPAMSRADMTGDQAATALGSRFYVYGIKNETGNVGTITTNDVNNVMDNYLVTYTSGSAMTSASNTEGWEYVGNSLTADKDAKYVLPNAGAGEVQTIKYWDWGATDYTFTAITALGTDIDDGKVVIKKINAAKDASDNALDEYDQGYTITIKKAATLSNIYIADRVNIKPTDNKNRTAENVYGGQVNFKFRSLGTQVRVGMFEMVPGYTVTIDKMYGATTTGEGGTSTTAESTTNFIASCPNISIATGEKITATVTYIAPETPTVEGGEAPNKAVVNHPTVAFSGEPKALVNNTTLTLGTGIKEGVTLAETSTTPTYDKEGGAYTFVFPQETNTTDMTVKLDYTLKCDATGEVIKVKDAEATVPAKYLQWKPNFSYTYLFKISDNTNGKTNPELGPAGLYPITFDAVVVDAGDGIAEYITTVSDPSITTIGVKDGKYVANASAYATGTDIYAVVGNGAAITKSGEEVGNVNLYTVTTSDATNFPITEAAVAEVIYEKANGTLTGTPKLTVADATGTFVTKVPGEDGVEIEMNALTWKPTTAATYAVEYITKAPVPATYDSGTTLEENTSLDEYYTKDADKYTQCKEGDKAVEGVTYYKKNDDNTYSEVTETLTAGESDVKDYYTLDAATYTKCEAGTKVSADNATDGTSEVTYYKQTKAYEPAKAQYKVVVVK